MNKKTGRPRGTRKLPTQPPKGLEAAIVRAVFPAGFPVGPGFLLFEMLSTRKELQAIKRRRIKPPFDDYIDFMIERREALEKEFETQCTVAALNGDARFFEAVARGVAALEAISGENLAVAYGWHHLQAYCSITNPTPAQVAKAAMSYSRAAITASKARDILRRMGVGGK